MPSSFAGPEPVFLDIAQATERVGGAEALNGLLLLLEEGLARDIPRIAELLQAGDARAANRLLHGIKGNLPIFCVDAICQHVVRVEELSKHGGAADVAAAYAALQPELQMLLAEVSDYLNGPA